MCIDFLQSTNGSMPPGRVLKQPIGGEQNLNPIERIAVTVIVNGANHRLLLWVRFHLIRGNPCHAWKCKRIYARLCFEREKSGLFNRFMHKLSDAPRFVKDCYWIRVKGSSWWFTRYSSFRAESAHNDPLFPSLSYVYTTYRKTAANGIRVVGEM